MTTRRGFLGAILAAGMAPAVVGSGILMPIKKVWVPDEPVLTPAETVNIVGGHGLRIGDRFTISGMTAPAGGLAMFTVTSVVSGVVTVQAA